MTRRTPLVATALVLAGLTLSPAQAAFPGENGRIAFERGRDVWTMNSDGSGATALTTGGGTLDPAMGPGGTRVAFSRGGDIWVMNGDGSDPRDLTPSTATERAPAWSPDGARIAFSRFVEAERSYRIWVMDADGSNQIQVTFESGGDFEPAWSPDGSLIAYTRQDNSTEIYTVNPAQPGSEQVYVTSAETTEDQPTWAPDGSAIAFRTNRRQGGGDDIYKQVGRGGAGEAVTNNPAADSEPTWSPDGTRIAFQSNRSGSNQIWTVASTGVENGPVNLSGASTTDSQPDWGTLGADPEPPPPTIGQTVNAEAVEGTVLVKLPPPAGTGRAEAAGSEFIPLSEATQLPIGSTFNTKRGTVRLTTAASPTTNAVQKGTFRGGVFKTRQSRSNPLTELRLRGAGLNRCSKLPRGGASEARRRSRRLFGRTRRGRFRTRGRNSTATVRGTKWLTKDTCRGTLTVVRAGSVKVRDLVKRKNVVLKKGGKRTRYLARAPKRR